MVRTTLRLSLIAFSLSLAFAAQAQDAAAVASQQREAALARLTVDSGSIAQVSLHSATGTARFLRAAPGGKLGAARSAHATTDAGKQASSVQFLSNYGSIFGVTNATAELGAAKVFKDRQGGTHITYKQMYQGVPVFGAELKTHFDAADNLSVVNGTFVRGIDVSPQPSRTADEASKTALAIVKAELGRAAATSKLATTATLMIYREGLARGVEGANHLAWQVEVGNRADVRQFVYIDAHNGKLIEKINGIHDALNRRAFDSQNATAPGPNYPNAPFWVEGQAFPTGLVEADNMISASSDIYNLFKVAFGRDSYDANGATMISIFNRGNACPNASWGGEFISFCPGTTTDDVTAHEWGPAYPEYTHGLIYAWQPGALNEAYSDIWGETVDRINGRGGDTPDAGRTPGVCTVITGPAQSIVVTSPASIAGVKNAGTAAWGPQTFTLSGSVAGVDIGSAAAGCAALPAGSLAGKIAFIDRGTCGFSVKALNAQNAGAVAAIIGNNQGATVVSAMSVTAGSVPTIPSLMMSQNDGTDMKAALAAGAVSVTLNRAGAPSYNNVRWLIGEDSAAFGGAIRDMYNPTCYGNPGKVTDTQYSCSTADSGGVHGNSGVPNHAYALLVDGGAYNGQTVAAIGLTKAAHIYYRAQSVYQGPASGFADHADALDQSCSDLTGVPLADLKTGVPSKDVITAQDCAQVTKVAAAVELRVTPTQCNFQPMLGQSPPALCEPGTTVTGLLGDTFDGGKKAGVRWLLSNGGTADFTPRNWGVVRNLPGNRPGYAMFAVDFAGGTCAPGGDQSGVMSLESPEIVIPAGTAARRMTFDHWMASEAGFDGGNLKISVNGGTWQVVSAANFIYNAYNTTLSTAAAGNTNPMAGQQAFSGSDGGSVNGSWGRSIVNLAPYGVAGDRIKLRFDMGTDGCGGTFGWYLDDIMVYRCVAP